MAKLHETKQSRRPYAETWTLNPDQASIVWRPVLSIINMKDLTDTSAREGGGKQLWKWKIVSA